MGTDSSRPAVGSQTPQAAGWCPSSEDERQAVRQQLGRILASPGFRNSRKYPAFLRFIVEHTLSGQSDQLKERTLGIEVFGRPSEYDTGVDPVVRIVAAEVRKRIGQYYHESAAPGELLLDLPCGSYVPRFNLPEHPASPSTEQSGIEPVVQEEGIETREVKKPAFRRRSWRIKLGMWHAVAALALMATAAGMIWWGQMRPNAMQQFWQPLLDSPGRLLVVTGGGVSWIPSTTAATSANLSSLAPLSVDAQQSRDLMAVADATTLAAVVGTIGSYRRTYLIRPSALLDLPQLRTGSAILIGAYNNPWTLRLTAKLRFSFIHDETTHTNWIQDRKNPAMRDWKVVTTLPYTSVTEDWAVISRFRNADTEHWIVTAPGLSRWGTVAAGDFLTNPDYLEELAKRAPAGWQGMNLQAVIATTVINGQPGRPNILATEFW